MPYYVAIAFDHSQSRYNALFGDSDQAMVEAESEILSDNDFDGDYSDWRIDRLPSARQSVIDRHVWNLNRILAAS